MRIVDEGIPLIGAYFNRALDERAAMEDEPNHASPRSCTPSEAMFPLLVDEMVQTLMLFFQAVLDTVSGTLGFIMEFLATHPEHRQLLIEEPTLIPMPLRSWCGNFSIVMVTRRLWKRSWWRGSPFLGATSGDPTASAGRDELQY